MSRFILKLFAAGVLSWPFQCAIAADPNTQPATSTPATMPLSEQVKLLRESRRTTLRDRWIDAPIAKTLAHDELVHFSIVNGFLHADTAPVGEAAPSRIAVSGTDATWVITRRGTAPMLAGGANLLNQVVITRYDFTAPDDQSWTTYLTVSERGIILNGNREDGDVALMQFGGEMRLRVLEPSETGRAPRSRVMILAKSFSELRSQHPKEFRQFAMPLLGRFSNLAFLLPGPSDVYTVFTDVPADPLATDELQQIIPRLDDDDPAERQSASDRLEHLGSRGILAVLRLNQSGLSEEQKLRLHALVMANRRRPDLQAAAARSDRGFLIDCLEYDDPAIRSAAKTELERVVGHEISFDTTRPPSDCWAAVDDLRATLLVSHHGPASAPAIIPNPAGR